MNGLSGRTVFIPRMPVSHARTTAAVFRACGVDARPVPESDDRSLSLGRSCCSGDECYPLIVTLGDFLRVLVDDGSPARATAFFMPTSSGPCRFGQYADFIRTALRDRGFGDALIVSPTSENAYEGLGVNSSRLLRGAWWGFVAADHLTAMLLKIRPREALPGEADKAFDSAIETVCAALADPRRMTDMGAFLEALRVARDHLRRVSTGGGSPVLIGLVGEIFCRNNSFSNMEAIRCFERHGAECWLPGLAEWVHYTNLEEVRGLKRQGARAWFRLIETWMRHRMQERDGSNIESLFREDLADRPELSVERMLALGTPYLPSEAALGEMALSVARAVYLHRRGVSGIVDISPFTCMNAIVAEAVYPSIVRDCDGIPIRTFYFDGTQANLDRDVGVFLQLARSYATRRSRAGLPQPLAAAYETLG